MTIILGLVILHNLGPSIQNVMMLLVGLFAMASLSAFYRILETPNSKPLVQITFNEHFAANQLETAAKRAGLNIIDAEVISPSKETRDVTPEDLLGQDNSLALAKLRIDIERELRRIAASVGIEDRFGRLGLRRLTEQLAKSKALEPEVLTVLDDILPIANQAIHGKEVSINTANAIVQLGRQLVAMLRATLKNEGPYI